MTAGLFDLTGRRVLVTGATGGLGTAIVAALTGLGAKVLPSDRHISSGHSVDLSDQADLAALSEACLRFGVTDLCLNAGVEGPVGPLAQTGASVGAAALEALFQINVMANLRLLSDLLPAMAGRGGGSVVLMSSIAGLRGNGRIGAYGMTKAALAQLARNIAVEWGPKGIRANALAPGLIDTPFAEGLKADTAFMARRLQATPLRRMGQPTEIAATVAWLISPAAGFVTGQTIVADGGTLISDGS